MSVTAESGVCTVVLEPGALYLGAAGLRRSSYLEFMAQAFGYVRAAQSASGYFPERPAPKKAFLVSIQDAVYTDEENLAPPIGTRLRIEITGIREIGAITLFAAAVAAEDGRALVRARLKVFSE